MNSVSFLKMPSPVGELTICSTDRAVVGIAFEFEESLRRMTRYIEQYYSRPAGGSATEMCGKARAQLCEYFDKKRRGFDFPIEFRGSQFQHDIWSELARVGFGETLSYSQLAAAAGHPEAPRAVGAACGANPLAIVLPCHRIVGTNKSLTKFGGGLDAKRFLLRHEGHAIDERYRLAD